MMLTQRKSLDHSSQRIVLANEGRLSELLFPGGQGPPCCVNIILFPGWSRLDTPHGDARRSSLPGPRKMSQPREEISLTAGK